jgi:hypothetical protein
MNASLRIDLNDHDDDQHDDVDDKKFFVVQFVYTALRDKLYEVKNKIKMKMLRERKRDDTFNGRVRS